MGDGSHLRRWIYTEKQESTQKDRSTLKQSIHSASGGLAQSVHAVRANTHYKSTPSSNPPLTSSSTVYSGRASTSCSETGMEKSVLMARVRVWNSVYRIIQIMCSIGGFKGQLKSNKNAPMQHGLDMIVITKCIQIMYQHIGAC